jgi:FixJ family two-component response regulator
MANTTIKEIIIAVVDDDYGVRKGLERLLRSLGFSVQAYASGEDFLAAVHLSQPDCVLLDLHLPGVNGLEVLRQLIAMHADFPTIIMTGNPNFSPDPAPAGAAAFLLKPLEDTQLLSALENALHL